MEPKIIKVEAIKPYYLHVLYETGEKKVFDVKPYIIGSWFGELLDWQYFKKVYVLPDGSGIEWINGQDIAPHELYECGKAI